MDRTSRRIYRVFISSTSVDLQKHREVVNDTIVHLQQFSDDMARFGARSGNAVKESLAAVKEADIYIGIFAWRYGTILLEEHLSITHLEYNEAIRRGLPCLIFIADPSTESANGPSDLFPAANRDPEHQELLHNFHDELRRKHITDTFTSPEDLGRRVATALSRYLLQIIIEDQIEDQQKRLLPPRELPPKTFGFVGRNVELLHVEAALRQGTNIAIVGMGGIGKSTFAAEILHYLAIDSRNFAGGIKWVRCDEREGLEGLIWIEDQILESWGILIPIQELGMALTFEKKLELREKYIRQQLHDRIRLHSRALILLDNVERELPISRALNVLVEAEVTTLITSRYEPASIQVLLFHLGVLNSDTAFQLFVERYKAREGRWEPQSKIEFVMEVVQILGYLPLAIDLAAAWAARTQMDLDLVCKEIQSSGVLKKLRDPLDATASVKYVLEKSLAFVNEVQRVRFAAISLIDGIDLPRGIVENVFYHVLPNVQEDASETLDVFAAISLIDVLTPKANEHEARVRMHPLLRELSSEAWHQLPVKVQELGLQGLLDTLYEWVNEHRKKLQKFARWDIEYANQLKFMDHDQTILKGAIQRSIDENVGIEKLYAIVEKLEPYLNTAYVELGKSVYAILLDVFQRLGDKTKEMYLFLQTGRLAENQGQYEKAVFYYDQSLAIAEEIDDHSIEAHIIGDIIIAENEHLYGDYIRGRVVNRRYLK